MARLAADLDDLRAAMDWAAESGDLRGLVDITEPIVRFWFERGLSGEVHRRLHDAAEGPGAPDDERVRGLITAALLALRGETGQRLSVGEPGGRRGTRRRCGRCARARVERSGPGGGRVGAVDQRAGGR